MTKPLACDRCQSTRHLIDDDGPVVCFPCLELLTNAAADPSTASPLLRDVLAELHADIVALVEGKNGHPEWAWLGDWPGVRV